MSGISASSGISSVLRGVDEPELLPASASTFDTDPASATKEYILVLQLRAIPASKKLQDQSVKSMRNIFRKINAGRTPTSKMHLEILRLRLSENQLSQSLQDLQELARGQSHVWVDFEAHSTRIKNWVFVEASSDELMKMRRRLKRR
jgi:hypothetical protein